VRLVAVVAVKLSFMRQVIITAVGADRPGIVGSVGTFLADHGCNIVESAQFGDVDSGRFFMRVLFETLPGGTPSDDVKRAFAAIAGRFGMAWQLHDAGEKPRVMIMVSRQDHCLNDLLFRARSGQLEVEIGAIVSNHPDFAELAASYRIPFHHLPLAPDAGPDAKRVQERQVEALIDDAKIDLVVLARYMQILSPEFCAVLKGRAINIHHSFLPSFKGARPYHQAHDRGVKLIGATAHYVTADLDEGPIIEQDVERVDHALGADEMTAVGRDVESVVLARAVRWHVQHRVLMNGHKTVVFT